jgi:hypothetical protein
MPHDLESLIRLLESAAEPSRALDFEIFRYLNPQYAGAEWQPYANGLRHVNDGSDMRCMPPPEATPPNYTRSLDAAVSLIPLHMIRRTSQLRFGAWMVELWKGDVSFRSPVCSEGVHETETIAMCVAGLRARLPDLNQGTKL